MSTLMDTIEKHTKQTRSKSVQFLPPMHVKLLKLFNGVFQNGLSEAFPPYSVDEWMEKTNLKMLVCDGIANSNLINGCGSSSLQ